MVQKISQWEEWNPAAYLKQYYTGSELDEDEQIISHFLVRFFKTQGQSFPRALEVGCGPTIHHAIPLPPFVQEITLADYIQPNLDEIRLWLQDNPTAHDWDAYIQKILKFELGEKPDRRALEARKRAMREKIAVRGIDLQQQNPLGTHETYPLVTAFYCADGVATSKEQWYNLMDNLFRLVSPGGWMIISAVRNADFYKVGDRYFPSPHVDENDMRTALEVSGFDNKTIDSTPYPVTMREEEGFNSIIIAQGQKMG